jgi:hypothetical protein
MGIRYWTRWYSWRLHRQFLLVYTVCTCGTKWGEVGRQGFLAFGI